MSGDARRLPDSIPGGANATTPAPPGSIGERPGPVPGCGPRPGRLAVALAVQAGLVNLVLDLWLHPHGVGYVLVALAGVGVAGATGFSERVLPVPRVPAEPARPPLSLKCRIYADIGPHTPCAGTTDDGTGRACWCWCHGRG